MNYFIPTYEQAVKMTGGTEDLFYSSEHDVNGYKVVTFCYRLAQYSDFINPPGLLGEGDAFEMRGLTFVFNKDGSLFKRYLLLNKFFNINQVPGSLYSDVKNLKVKNVYSKEDGSAISFIKLPNGDVVAKTKMSFQTDQSEKANLLYRTKKDIKRIVDWSLDNDIVAIFEYVSPKNRIVLKYQEDDLILLKLRCNKTGKYLDLDKYIGDFKLLNVSKKKYHSVDELLELAKTEKDIEGWVVQFDNGHLVKIKTEWYFSLHGLLTEDVYRENRILKHILEDNIDDLISKIPKDEKESLDRIDNLVKTVQHWLKQKMSSVLKTYEVYKEIGNDKEFALKYKTHDNFHFVMSYSKGKDLHDSLIDHLKWKTYRLEEARKWLEEVGKEDF